MLGVKVDDMSSIVMSFAMQGNLKMDSGILNHMHIYRCIMYVCIMYVMYAHVKMCIWLAFKIPGLKDYIKWAQLELKSWFYIFAMKRAP